MNTMAPESDAAPAPVSRTEGAATEWLLRAFAVVLLVVVVARWGHAFWIDNSRWTALLLLVSEAYTLVLVLLARRALQRDLAPLALAATVYACCAGALLGETGTVRLAPEGVGAALLIASMAWQFTAKVYLGRSFGLLPAQRGLVVAGPYRFVRHPIYCGYMVGHVGFLLANFSVRNVLVLVLLYAAQAVRIRREEAVLAPDPAYGAYCARVRWRLLPGLW